MEETVTVLILGAGEYREHGVFHRGAHADSPNLPGLSIRIRDLFDAGAPRRPVTE